MSDNWKQGTAPRSKSKAEPAASALLALGSGPGGLGSGSNTEPKPEIANGSQVNAADTATGPVSGSLMSTPSIIQPSHGAAANVPGGPHSAGGSVGPSARSDGTYYNGVEEAVMHLVGGTLREDRSKKRKNASQPPLTSTTQPLQNQFDHDISGFTDYNGSWDKFLNDDIAGGHQDDYTLFDQAIGRVPQSAGGVPKRRKTASQSGRAAASTPHGPVVDPALAHLDGNTSTALVEQAILQTKDQHHLLQTGILAGQQRSPADRAHRRAHDRMEDDDDAKDAAAKAGRAWSGDGSETGGAFDDDEAKALDDFMQRFCQQNDIDREKLCERVWSGERKKDRFWDAVAAVLPHRTRASVYKHVRRTYHVFTVRGKWSPAEDYQLGVLFDEKGAQWKAIGLAMHRMPEDCRDRWRNYVKCGEQRKQNKWSPKEEEMLQHVVNEIIASSNSPINWTTVSERMGGTRSRIQCRYKWKKLSKRLAQDESFQAGDRLD